MSAAEFSRPVRLDTLGDGPRTVRFAAAPAERAALAERFGLVSIDRLELTAEVSREGAVVLASGGISASVVQSCVATGEDLPATVDAPLALRFLPEGDPPPDDEIELSEADCDTLSYSGGAADLGEAAAETLLLALDPFPRRADADTALREAGVIAEEDLAPRAAEDGPFAALKALKDRLDG